MKIILRNKYLSRQRFSRYLQAAGSNSTRAKRLYAANIRLAQAFHPILSQFEVVFRNSLNTVLATHFADPQGNPHNSRKDHFRSNFWLLACLFCALQLCFGCRTADLCISSQASIPEQGKRSPQIGRYQEFQKQDESLRAALLQRKQYRLYPRNENKVDAI